MFFFSQFLIELEPSGSHKERMPSEHLERQLLAGLQKGLPWLSFVQISALHAIENVQEPLVQVSIWLLLHRRAPLSQSALPDSAHACKRIREVRSIDSCVFVVFFMSVEVPYNFIVIEVIEVIDKYIDYVTF